MSRLRNMETTSPARGPRRLAALSALALACLAALALGVFAPRAAIASEAGQGVRLTVEYTQDSLPVSGVGFDLYYVATVDDAGRYALAGDFAGYPVELDGLDADGWRALADTLASYADRDGLAPFDSGATNERGNLYFPNTRASLPEGLYLAVGRTFVKDGYSYETEPFLVALPYADPATGELSYEVVVEPKHEREEVPPEGRTVSVKALKVWSGDAAEVRPASVEVQLLRDGEVYDTQTLSAANSWRFTWSDLPEFTEAGAKVSWRVAEAAAPELADYKVLVSRDGTSFVVANTYAPEEPEGETVERTVVKVWDDKGSESGRPASVTVTLLADGAAYDTQVLSDANGWRFTWTDLPATDSDGEAISWWVSENAVAGYTPSVSASGATLVLINSVSSPKLPQTGQLWWPVPVLALGGLALLVVGAALGRRKAGEGEGE